MKKNFKSLGEFLSQLFCIGALLGGTACTEDDVTGSGNVPLQVSVTANSPLVSRAIVTDEYLPDGSTIGVSLFAADGSSYDNQNYSNVKYTAAGTGDAQVWTGASDVSLSGNPATVVAYYPWQEGADLTAVPVETASQTDYMWAETLTGVANTNPGVELVMNHALTAVRVKLVLGDYTGDVFVSGISVASPALGTAASLDVLGGEGALADITGQGDAVELDVDFDMTAEGTSTDIMLVPDASATSGKTVVSATIGGKKFAAGIAFDEAYKQGYVYTYTITLNNKGFEVTKVAVIPWEDGGLKEAEFVPEKDDAYIIKIVASYVAQAEPASLDVNDGVATFSRNSGDSFIFNHNVMGFVGTIDWGDGTTTTYDVATDRPTHQYANDGAEYIITAKGTIPAFFSENHTPFGQCLKEIVYIGSGCNIVSFDNAFSNCQGLTNIPEGLFDKCTKVEDFTGTFAGCTALQAIPEGLFDKCSNVISFYNTFWGCENLQEIPVGLFDNCTEVTSFQGTFGACDNLQTIPQGLFDNCTKVTTFSETFSSCDKLLGVPEGLFDNCTKVTSFEGAFRWCSGLQEIPEGLFDNNTKVTNFGYAFLCCTSLQNIPEGLFDNNTEVTHFFGTFMGCENLQTIPEGLFDKCTEVTSFFGTFNDCWNLQTIPEGLFDKCTEVTSFEGTFEECINLTGESPYTLVDGVKVHLYERKNYPEYFTNPTSYGDCFYKCEGLTDYANIPTNWK